MYECVVSDWKNRSCRYKQEDYKSDCAIVLTDIFKSQQFSFPEIIILDSPLACLLVQLVIKTFTEKETPNRFEIRHSIHEAWEIIMLTNQCFSVAYDLNRQEDIILDNVCDVLKKKRRSIYAGNIQPKGGNFFEQVLHQRNIDSVKKMLSYSIWEAYFLESPVFNSDFMLSSLNQYIDLNGKNYPWTYNSLVFYDFMTRLQVINDPLFNDLKSMLLNNVFDIVYFGNICLISKLPHWVTRNEEGQLHSYDGDPAIEFADGYRLYFENGKRVSKWDAYANLF